jgi:WD40 repeat protein
MHKYITRACVAAAAGVALTTLGVTGASASGAAPRALRGARMSAAGASPAAASPGAQLWVKRYDGSNSTDDATSVAVSPGGGSVFVTGSSMGTTSSEDYATVGYNAATGAQLWASRYNGPDNSEDEASSVAISPDGKTVFVTGYSFGTTAGEVDYATVAYSAATGAQLWAKRYISPALQGFATSVAVSPDGKAVFVTGYSGSQTSGGYDYATVAYNPATGAQLWVKRYAGPAGDDFAHSMTVSGSTVYVTGSSIGTNNGYDYATVAYNAATGAQLWAKRYTGAPNGNRGANSVAASPDGKTVFVTGSSYAGSTTDYDYATVAYNAATGAQLWAKRYTGPGSGDDQAYSVAASPDGKTVFVTGYSSGTTAGQVDYATVAYNAATGARLWVKHYGGPAKGGIGTQAYSVAVSPSGSTVYVTGESGNDSTYATVAYSAATGTQQWVKRYTGNGPSGSAANAVTVSPTTGTVYVTGYSSGSGTGNDYATIAYQG